MASRGILRALAVCRRPSASQYTHLPSTGSYSALSYLASNRLSRESPALLPNLERFHCRNLTSSIVRANKHSIDPAQTANNGTQPTGKRTLFQRFKDDFARYWYVMLPIHITTSFGYFLCFYYLSKVGVSPVPLMDLIGVPAQYIDPIRDSTASHVAVGYAGYKLITPFRYITTIGVTGVTVRALSSRGFLRPMPTFEEFKTSAKAKIQSIRGK